MIAISSESAYLCHNDQHTHRPLHANVILIFPRAEKQLVSSSSWSVTLKNPVHLGVVCYYFYQLHRTKRVICHVKIFKQCQ